MAENAPPIWHGLVAGGSSAVVSRLFTYPPDTVKARLQMQTSGTGAGTYSSTMDAFYKIARKEGFIGFYRGFGAILLTVIPANMCYFSGYEFGKRIAPRDCGIASDFMTASIAQTVAGIAFCPIDIVKQRVQTASVVVASSSSATAAAGAIQQHITPTQAAMEVWRHQGFKGFYKGYWTMNALWFPWNAIYLTMYEASKRQVYYWQLRQNDNKHQYSDTRSEEDILLEKYLPMQQVLPVWAFPVCSSTCAAVAAVVTHPIDVVKTRLQVLSSADHTQKWTVSKVMKDLYRNEGMTGFSRGMSARVGTMSVGSSISWFVYEMVKRRLGEKEQE